MKISRAWLNDFVDLKSLTDSELEDIITTKIAEVDETLTSGVPLEQAICVEVLSFEPHPERKKLNVVVVSDSKKEYKVVCGAPNVRKGMLTAYIPDGCPAMLGQDLITLQPRDFAGIVSKGMLSSETELDVSSEGEGILDIQAGIKPGQKLAKIYGEPDYILEIDNKSLTHRPDLWSHFGFARELAAILGKKLKVDLDSYSDATKEGAKKIKELAKTSSPWSVKIEKDSEARRFTLIEISNVKPQKSPEWLRRRLHNVGAGVRNQLVDLSNYVMLDCGQPNHTYDADKLKGKTISVRNASKGEKFEGLDGVTYELESKDVVIADDKGVVALGGVIGGNESAVNDGTTKILLESANFCPTRVRLTTKNHQLRTDASNRFEKSRSAYSATIGSLRYLELIQKLQPEAKLSAGFQESFPVSIQDVEVELPKNYIQERLGAEIPEARIKEILEGLGFSLKSSRKTYNVKVPYYRATRDISIQDDLVEEVGRIYGFENIPEDAPLIASKAVRAPEVKLLEYSFSDALKASGFSQYESFSFMNAERVSKLGFSVSDAVELKNPVDSELKHMRVSLVPAMIEALCAQKTKDVRLFEIGRSFSGSEEQLETPVRESRKLCLGLSVEDGDEGEAFYSLQSVIKRLLSFSTENALQVKVNDKPLAWMHPYRAASIELNGIEISKISEVNPIVSSGKRIAISELDLEKVLELKNNQETTVQAPSRYPVSYFEMSVVMPLRSYYSELESLIRTNVSSELLKDLEVLSVYKGSSLPEGKKSVSVKMSFGSLERTLNGDEIEAIQNSLMQAVDRSTFELRS